MTDTDRHEFDILDSRVVYSGAILALRLDEVAMPNGRTAEREVVEHHGAVAVVVLDDENRLVLIHQYRHPVGRRLWEIPAGLLDEPDEDPLEAAKRELAEETGLAAKQWAVLVDVAVSPGFTDESVRVFLAEDLYTVHRPEPEHEEADLEIERFPLDEAVAMVLRGEIVNATAVSGIMSLAAIKSRPDTPLRDRDAPWVDRPASFSERKRSRAGVEAAGE
ncbi:ADP-ribose pyrophosphatase [Rhodococcus oxybenzonivorans]|uniref:ADP-ribose pyrophosphatase n=1 Tax=Rhodococcus oxybenzonivorans TaxID=1990687 RepID=A0A2S2BUY2_9NOCA|nr:MULTISPECIES: NUDIX hydrolase [Rhodococcus]AWK72392.1 ADP-ribose pyrophosphatase [Rhodococcus oxybenzonivorans]QTJ64542.1 NUDIX hydrolase [Rhodococcus sp. ZPP]